MKYRADIDGLRAVAVLAVVAFHLIPWVLPGGYVGVDVFFVISGYLITRILWGQLKKGTFSFATFYAKRIRRLFPALFAVTLVCAGIEYAVGLPQEIYTFGISALASVFYFSNHYFLSENSYFAEDLETNPLLHTWSLSVEEQFYIIFPALLVLLFRKGKGKEVLWIGGLLGGSLLLSEILVQYNDSASFYLMPSRLWQFLAGAMLALRPMNDILPRPIVDAIGWFGLGLLGYSFFYFSGATTFPGLNALFPTLGTFFLLFAGQHSGLWITRALSVWPARFIGHISYSLYLWHWPVIVFYKLEFSPDPSSSERFWLLAASFVLAYVSWRFIEQPFRNISLERKQRWVYAGGGIASLLLGLICAYFILTEGIKERYTEEQLSYIEYLSYDADALYRTDRCFLTSGARSVSLFDEEECLNIDSTLPNVLIVGDSHAAQYHAAFEKLFPGYAISQINASGCRPLVNYEGEERCTALMRTTFEQYIKEFKFDAIILAGRWEENDLPFLEPTIDSLAVHTDNIIVLGPILEYSQALPRLLAQKGATQSEITDAQQYREIEKVDMQMKKILDDTHVEYISVLKAMCPNKECIVYTQEGIPMQFDASHLTKEGAVELVGRLVDRGFLQKFVTVSGDF